jgi:HK97 gp10 family phage protein
MNNFQFDFAGYEQLEQMLTDAGSVLGTKAARAAAKKAMTVVLEDIKLNAPVDNNTTDGIHIKDSFKLKISKRTAKDRKAKNDTFLTASVVSHGPACGYIAQVEFGRAAYQTERDWFFHKRPVHKYQVDIAEVKPNPFMRTALYQNAQLVHEIVCQELLNELTKQAQNRTKIANQKINQMYNKARRTAAKP